MAPALGFATLIGLLTISLTTRAARVQAQDQALIERLLPLSDLDPGPPFGAMIEALADPVLLIAAQERDDLAGRRLRYANAAAREFFRIQDDGGLLITAITVLS